MKRNYILLAALLISMPCLMGMVLVHGNVALFSGGGGTTYVGYPNTNGTPDSDPSSSYGAPDVLVDTQWTATEDGTAKTINAYIAGRSGTIDYESVTLWKDIEGTITLIGQGSYSGTEGAWTGHITLVVEGGQSLSFSSGDTLYFGGCGSSNNTYSFGRNDTGGTGMYYITSGDYSSGPPATTTFSFSSDRQMGFIFGYDPS